MVRAKIAKALLLAARWIFLAGLVFAPWAYGGTTSASIVAIESVLGIALLLWLLGLLVSWRKPAVPILLLLLSAGLLVIGGWMVLNATAIYDPEFRIFTFMQNPAPNLPGSIDYALSAAWMIRVSILLASTFFIVDLAQNEKALLQLWSAIGIAAGSISLLGLLQKATGAQAILWQSPIGYYGSTFFATYYYHANAGAFLNLVLPFTAGLAVRAFGRPATAMVRATWLAVFVLNLTAVAANTSRMAQAIAVLVLIALLWQVGPVMFRRLSHSEKNIALAGGAAIAFTFFAVAQASHLEQPLNRWQTLTKQLSVDARWSAARTAMTALPDVGAVGFGPGTFRVAFPYYQTSSHSLPGEWRFLHQDYLQTAMEWGWLGSALWALLFFGGIVFAIRNFRTRSREKNWRWRQRLIVRLSVIALLGVAIHAAVDFPLQIFSIQIYVAIYLGLCWASGRWGQPQPGEKP